MFYSEGGATFLGQGYVKERLKSSLRKFYGRYEDLTKQYEVPLSRMLHDILDDDHIQWHPPLIGHYTNFWPLLIWTWLPNSTFYLIVHGFHRTYATGAACQQRTLTPPDTWSCPTLGLACVLMSRPISPELVLSPDFWILNTPRYFSFASNKLLGQGYVKERLKSCLRKFYGRYGDLTKQYKVPLSRMLHDILDDDNIQWRPPLIRHYTNFWPLLIWTWLPNSTFYLIVHGFHRTYATGAVCQHRTLTPPDTWSCPTLGLACVLMSRPIFPELVLSPVFWISNIPWYFTFAFSPNLFNQYSGHSFQSFSTLFCLRITDEGSFTEMHV